MWLRRQPAAHRMQTKFQVSSVSSRLNVVVQADQAVLSLSILRTVCHQSARFYAGVLIARNIPTSFRIGLPLSRGPGPQAHKKTPFQRIGTASHACVLIQTSITCRAWVITRAFQLARTQHLVHSTTGRFSGLRPTERLLPIRRRIVDWAFP